MPRSNWGKLSKAIAGLAALAAVIVAYLLWSEAGSEDLQHKITAEQNADYYANTAGVEAQLECAVANVSDEECGRQAQQAARPDQRDEYDLAAQRTMAAWTRAMGKAAVIGVAVGILGLGLIFVTFRETRKAADAGWRANEIADENAKKQLRAYIGLESGGLEYPDLNAWPTARIFLKNFGQTPAYDFRGGMNVVVRPKGHRIALGKPAEDIAPSMLAPGQGFMLVSEQTEADAASPGGLPGSTLYVMIGCEYRDAFGEYHEFKLCMVQSGWDGLQPYPTEECPANDDDQHRADG